MRGSFTGGCECGSVLLFGGPGGQLAGACGAEEEKRRWRGAVWDDVGSLSNPP